MKGKYTIVTILALILFPVASYSQEDGWRSPWPDKIITIHRDTINCEIVQYSHWNSRLYYKDHSRDAADGFILYNQVALVYLGADAKYYTLNSRGLKEYTGASLNFDREICNRVTAAVGYRDVTKIGVSFSVGVGYTRYLLKNTGVGISVMFDKMAPLHVRHQDWRRLNVNQINTFTFTPYVTQRIDLSRGASFLNLYAGYAGYLKDETVYIVDSHNKPTEYTHGYMAGVGVEYIMSSRSSTALELAAMLYNDGFGITLGIKFGK